MEEGLLSIYSQLLVITISSATSLRGHAKFALSASTHGPFGQT